MTKIQFPNISSGAGCDVGRLFGRKLPFHSPAVALKSYPSYRMVMGQCVDIVKLADAISTASVCGAWLYREWGHRRSGSSLARSIEIFLARAQDGALPMAFVAIADGQPVGTASLLAGEEPTDAFGPWLGSLYVLPEIRRTGVARKLIATVETEALALGFDRLWLSTSIPEMYRKLAYHLTGHQRHGEPVMMKRLA